MVDQREVILTNRFSPVKRRDSELSGCLGETRIGASPRQKQGLSPLPAGGGSGILIAEGSKSPKEKRPAREKWIRFPAGNSGDPEEPKKFCHCS